MCGGGRPPWAVSAALPPHSLAFSGSDGEGDHLGHVLLLQNKKAVKYEPNYLIIYKHWVKTGMEVVKPKYRPWIQGNLRHCLGACVSEEASAPLARVISPETWAQLHQPRGVEGSVTGLSAYCHAPILTLLVSVQQTQSGNAWECAREARKVPHVWEGKWKGRKAKVVLSTHSEAFLHSIHVTAHTWFAKDFKIGRTGKGYWAHLQTPVVCL